MKTLSAIILTFIICHTASAAELKPFTSDGCSAFPDGALAQQNIWLECCVEHDKAYWAGGTSEEREAADEDLKRCVARVGHPEIAELMLAGVRVGGTPYLPTSFRWGYGWPFPRGYKPLSEEEQQAVQEMLSDYHIKQPE